jgi:iron(III) transport system substrate-binding protein
MKIIVAVLFVLLLTIGHGASLFAGAAPESAGQILARLNKLLPEQRQAALIEKAKTEGEVNFYSTLQAQQIEPFLQVFRKRYPFVKPVPTRVSGNRQLVRLQSEFNSGAHIVDVANGSPELAAGLRKLGIIDPYLSPQRDFYVAPSKDKDGYFTSFYVMPIVLGYNSNLVKRAEAPKNYQELVQPKWKGNIMLDDEAYEWFAVMLRHLGREKGLQYMRAMAKQDLRMVRGRTAQSQLLAAGERAIAINVSGPTTLDLKSRGAPVDQVIVDPYFSQPNKMVLARHAPHPHAAALFIDWALSEEGQSTVTTFGRVSARKGVKQRFPELLEKEIFHADVEFISPIMEQITKEFGQIFLGR